ncbi:hypothetical protein ACFWR9_41625 [Streptomyces sp. NPDC058534]|uniref:hypothetical protein n=1 Tax=Streptomyces sp. NPDC058534 TaxID=3346541 RepID=UPI0036480A6F
MHTYDVTATTSAPPEVVWKLTGERLTEKVEQRLLAYEKGMAEGLARYAEESQLSQ